MNTPNANTTYKKVMVIEDTHIDRVIAERSMIKYSFAAEVVLKESVRTALEYLLSFTEDNIEKIPQLILLDINMPELNGFDFLDEFEKLPGIIQNNCTIMMLTTSQANEDYKKATSYKCVQDYINKPLDKEKLAALTINVNQFK